jgi:hypothetical protein
MILEPVRERRLPSQLNPDGEPFRRGHVFTQFFLVATANQTYTHITHDGHLCVNHTTAVLHDHDRPAGV